MKTALTVKNNLSRVCFVIYCLELVSNHLSLEYHCECTHYTSKYLLAKLEIFIIWLNINAEFPKISSLNVPSYDTGLE